MFVGLRQCARLPPPSLPPDSVLQLPTALLGIMQEQRKSGFELEYSAYDWRITDM